MEPLECGTPVVSDHAQLYTLLVAELTDFAVFLIDPDGCIVSWNPGVERILGYAEADWVGRSVHMIFTPEDRAAKAPEEEMAKANCQGRSPDVRWHKRKDGSRLFVEGTLVALKDNTGQLLGFSKVMRDITERKLAEEALRESADRFRALVNASSDVLYRMSPEWSEMRQLGGGGFIPDTESPTTDWLQKYIHPDDQPRVIDAIEQAIRTKSVFELEHRVLRVDGSLGWTHSRAVPLLDASGEIREWFGAASDITARKVAETERERLAVELARSNEDLTQFARIASHDLKAPLTTIGQFAQLLLRRYKGQILDETAEEYFGVVMSNVQWMKGLIEDLLYYARLDASRADPREPVGVNSVVETVLANLRAEIERSGAEVTYEALPLVLVDGTQLVQLFQNLIENAIKYRRPELTPRIHISVGEERGRYRFAVQDNGIGVDRDHWERIFLPFKRLHGRELPGTGIGLAICRKIVKSAGGRIWVESEPGQGSTFYFTLPA